MTTKNNKIFATVRKTCAGRALAAEAVLGKHIFECEKPRKAKKWCGVSLHVHRDWEPPTLSSSRTKHAIVGKRSSPSSRNLQARLQDPSTRPIEVESIGSRLGHLCENLLIVKGALPHIALAANDASIGRPTRLLMSSVPSE